MKTKCLYSLMDLCKHSVTPKHIPAKDIILSVESILACQRELPELTKYDVSSRILSTLQSASLTDCNLMKDTLKQLKNDKDIVILSADKGCVTVVMDKKDYSDKMNSLVNDKQTCEPLMQTTYSLKTNCSKSSSTSSHTLWLINKQETVKHCLLFIFRPIYLQNLRCTHLHS